MYYVVVPTHSNSCHIRRQGLWYHAHTDSICPMIGNLYWQQDQPRWWQGWSVTLNNDVVNVLWWPMCQTWLPLDDLSNDDWLPQDNPIDDTWLPYDHTMDKLVMTLIIKGWHLMTLDDSNRQFLSSKLKVACLEENSIYGFFNQDWFAHCAAFLLCTILQKAILQLKYIQTRNA
jgi:hypothetical protein